MDNYNSGNELKPTITVIIPCYNAETTIERTLDSLSKQTYRSFELLIINDGSKDNSNKIIESYLKNSNLNYRYIDQKNAGVSVARNVGLANARGRFITFLDADDIYHPYFLEILSEAVTIDNIDTAYCCYSRNVEKLLNDTRVKPERKNVHKDRKSLMLSFMYRRGPCAFFSFIYKKSILENNNITFTENSKYGEDLEFTWKYLTHCEKGAFVDIPLYGYYNNPTSVMNNITWRVTDALCSVKRVEDYLEFNNIEFYYTYHNYMFDRTLLALLKDFSKFGRRDLFLKLITKFDTKDSMRSLVNKSPNYLVKLSALIFCVNQKLFYHIIKKIHHKRT